MQGKNMSQENMFTQSDEELPELTEAELLEIEIKKDNLKGAPGDALVAVQFASDMTSGLVRHKWLFRAQNPIL